MLKRIVQHRRVVARMAFYLLGGLLQPLAYLLLLPFLIATLDADEYSRFGLMISVLSVLLPLLSLEIHRAPARLYFDHADHAGRASLLASCLGGALIVAAIGLALVWAIVSVTPVADPVGEGSALIRGLIVAAVLGTLAFQFGAATMRVRGRAGMFALVMAAQGVVLLGFYLGAEPLVGDHFVRSVMAVALSRVAGGLVGLRDSSDALRGGRANRAMFRAAAAFSAPLAAHQLAMWGVNYSGRWIGLAFMSLDDLASFTLVTQITAAVNMIGQALFQARLPEIGAAFGRRQHRHGARLVVQTTLLGLGLVVAAYATLFVVLCGLDVPLPEAYRPSLTVLLVAAAANLCFSIHLQGVQILRNLKRTGTQAGSTLFSAGVTVALSFALGAALGETGLMIALAAGFAVQAASSNWLAVRALRAAGRAAR